MCAAAAAATAAFMSGRCLFGGAAAYSSGDDLSCVKSSCCWGRGRGRGRRYLSQALPNPDRNPDRNPESKILPQNQIQIQKQKQKVPCLMLSSPTKPESRYLYDVLTRGAQDSDDGMPLLAFNREIDLPQIAGHNCVGSSEGFLISVDHNAEIHATNPLTGAHLPLPSTVNLSNMIGVVRDPASGDIKYYVSSVGSTESPKIVPLVLEDNAGRTSRFRSLCYNNVETFYMPYMRLLYYHKLILSPSLDTAVALHRTSRNPPANNHGSGRLAFAKLGGDSTSSSSSWTDLPLSKYLFNDIIFHKGRLHAADIAGTLSVYDMENPSAQPFRSPEGPLLDEGDCLRRYVVESANGNDLFLVFRYVGDYGSMTQGFKVFKLDKSDYKWNQVDSVGDLALFVGFNHSMALSAGDFHGLKPNCIYFTDDFPEGHFYCLQSVRDTGVFSLKDGSIHKFSITDGFEELELPPPLWFMPAMC